MNLVIPVQLIVIKKGSLVFSAFVGRRIIRIGNLAHTDCTGTARRRRTAYR
jgi:hypothetical protein